MLDRKIATVLGSFIFVLLVLLGATYGFYLPLRVSLNEVETQATHLGKLLEIYCESLLEAQKGGYIRGKNLKC